MSLDFSVTLTLNKIGPYNRSYLALSLLLSAIILRLSHAVKCIHWPFLFLPSDIHFMDKPMSVHSAIYEVGV